MARTIIDTHSHIGTTITSGVGQDVATWLKGMDAAGIGQSIISTAAGGMQSGGRSSLRLLRVAKDGDLISEAREIAGKVLENDPNLEAHPALKEALDRRLDESAQAFLAKN